MATVDLDRMLHPDEARAMVLSRARSLGNEDVPLEEAGDRILADDLIADVDLPPFRASTMDGYAVVHDDGSKIRNLISTGFAGVDPDVTVTAGNAAKIMTGAPVPAGADAVVPVERTSVKNGRVVIQQEHVASGENIRPIGSDLRKGDVLVRAGSVIGPAEIGLLASLGYARVRVGRRPRVAILSTGDELVQPVEIPAPGQIRDSNRFSLGVAASRAGADIVINDHVPDRAAELKSVMSKAIAASNVLVTSGGVSMGDRDLVKALLGELAEVHFRRVFMKPGKPLNFATVGDKLIFGLPGNPVSCLVSFQLFVRPALQVMQSSNAEALPEITVKLRHSVQRSDRIEFQRAIVSAGTDGGLTAKTTGSQLSARLMSFVGANAFLIIPPGDQSLEEGDRVSALLFDTPVS